MCEALEEEYRSRAAYRSVIEAFGPVRPFVNIVEAEERHAGALIDLLEFFGVEPPTDNWAGRVPAPATLLEACRAGVEGEIENPAMYDRLLPDIADPRARRHASFAGCVTGTSPSGVPEVCGARVAILSGPREGKRFAAPLLPPAA